MMHRCHLLDRASVTSGVLQGIDVGNFVVCHRYAVTDLDDNMGGLISMSADNTKIGVVDGCEIIQRNILT